MITHWFTFPKTLYKWGQEERMILTFKVTHTSSQPTRACTCIYPLGLHSPPRRWVEQKLHCHLTVETPGTGKLGHLHTETLATSTNERSKSGRCELWIGMNSNPTATLRRAVLGFPSLKWLFDVSIYLYQAPRYLVYNQSRCFCDGII